MYACFSGSVSPDWISKASASAAEMSRDSCSRAAPPVAELSRDTPFAAVDPTCPVLMGVAIATAALLSAGLRGGVLGAPPAVTTLYCPGADCPPEEGPLPAGEAVGSGPWRTAA